MARLDKKQIIEILSEISSLLEIRDENIFKIRAYEMGVEGYPFPSENH